MSNWYCYNGKFISENELYHYGVKGMKWGRRKARPIMVSPGIRRARPIMAPQGVRSANSARAENQRLREQKNAAANTPEAKAARKKAMIKAGATAAAVALAAYGAYKVSERIKTNDAVRRTLLERADRAGIGKNVIYENTGNILSKNYNKGLQERLQRSGVNTKVVGATRRSTGELASEAAKKVASSVKDKASNAAKKAKVEFDYVTAKADNLAWKTGNTAKTVGNKAKSAATNAANKVKDYVSDYEMPSIRSNKVPAHLRNTTLDPRGNYWKKRRR